MKLHDNFRYFLLVMSFGAKVTKVKKITARSKTVEENAQLREAVKGVTSLNVFELENHSLSITGRGSKTLCFCFVANGE